jgi:hypothetical protein
MTSDLRDSVEVPLSLGGSTAVFRRDTTWRVDLKPLLPSAGAAVAWAGLDALPHLSEVWYRGADRGFLTWLRTRPGIKTVYWDAPEIDMLDLRAYPTKKLMMLDIDRPITLRLPPSTKELRLGGATALVTIEGVDFTESFQLALVGPTFGGLPRGLQDLRALDLALFDALDLAPLRPLTRLTTIKISKARITNIDTLAGLAHLREFEGLDLYHFDADAFPALPSNPKLDKVTIDGLRAEDAEVLRRRLKDVPLVTFRRMRSAAWLAANADNPFAEWGHVDAKAAKTAAKLWKKALGQARKAGPKPSAEQAKTILTNFLRGLSALPIDTIMGEEACEAAHDLMHKHLHDAMDGEATQKLIDEHGDF